MGNAEEKIETNVTKKYISLMSLINEMEKRLGWSELVLLSLNIAVFCFTINFVSSLLDKTGLKLTSLEILFALFCLVIGMAISAYWSAFAMRLQLKLKLRYFQARFLERKMDCSGECLLSDEFIFFDPAVTHIDSVDNKEILHYPASGMLRMDGFIGAAKPRHLSLLLPSLFFLFYLIVFSWLLIRFFI